MTEAQNRPKREYTPKPKPIFDFGDVNHSNGGYTSSMAPPPSRNSGRKKHNASQMSHVVLCVGISTIYLWSTRLFWLMHTENSTFLLLFVALRRLTETLMALDMQTESEMVWLFLCHGGVLTVDTGQSVVEPKEMSVCLCAQCVSKCVCSTLISADRLTCRPCPP